MTSTFNKVIVAVILTVLALGVVGFLTQSNIFANQAEAAGTCGSCGDTPTPTPTPTPNPTPNPTPVKPTCNLSLNIAEVSNIGDSYRLTWSGGPVSASFYINGAAVADSGAANFKFTGPNYDRFKMVGNNGGVTCEKEVRVIKKVIEAPVCVAFTATPTSLPVGGGSVKLTWDTTNATNATLDGQKVAGDGTLNVNVTANKTFTLNLSNSIGQKSCTVAVKVATPAPAPTCDSFTGAPATIVRGNSATLAWTTTNATTITISGLTGALAVDGSRVVTPTQTTAYTLTARNAAGTQVTCTRTITVTQPTPAPTCDSFTGAPASIIRGGSSILAWTTTGATSVLISNVTGTLAVDGSKSVSPTVTTTYILTAANANNVVVKCEKTITVVPPTPADPTCDEFTATPASIKKGESSTLKWFTTNAITATIDNAIGTVAVDGTQVVSPLQTTVYLLRAVAANSKVVTCPVQVTVTQTPVDTVPKCDFFTASDTSLPYGGGNVTLTWGTTRATGVTISQLAAPEVAVDGSKVVNVTETKTFILTARDADGDIDNSCFVKVLVAPRVDADISCAANVSFGANPTSINEGQNTTLTWNTTGVTRVSIDNGVSPINPDGSTRLDGSAEVSPNSDTTYTLTATKGSQTINCYASVNVDERSHGGGGGSSSPKCSLKISDSKISLGERVTLKWDTTRATEITLKDNHGKTLIDTDDKSSSEKKDLYDGEITIRPEKDTTYTLVAEKGSRDKTCKVSVDVEDTVVVTQIRDQKPLVTGIALTQVPYTGFEAGAFMTSVFYTLLAAWALYMAYVLVGRRNSMSAFTPATVMADIVPETTLFPETVTSAPVFYQAAAPVALSTATVGYAAHTDLTATLEAQAHTAHVLLSADAIAYFVAATANEDRTSILAGVLTAAKASYPSEDGWVVLSIERMVELAAKF